MSKGRSKLKLRRAVGQFKKGHNTNPVASPKPDSSSVIDSHPDQTTDQPGDAESYQTPVLKSRIHSKQGLQRDSKTEPKTRSKDEKDNRSESRRQSKQDRQNDQKRARDPLGNRIMDFGCFNDMTITIVMEHGATGCKESNIVLHDEVRIGLGSKLKFKCGSCGYMSNWMKTYKELGDKEPAVNVSLASGLQRSDIGIEEANRFISAFGIPPPSTSRMQSLMNGDKQRHGVTEGGTEQN